MRVLFGLLVVFFSVFTWAETDKPRLGEASIHSDSKTAKRLKPDAQICLQGESCAGQKPGQAVALSSSVQPKTPSGIYEANCASCHSAGIAGAPKMGDVAAWQGRLVNGFDHIVKSVVVGKGAMPPMGMCTSCSEDDIKGVVKYILDETGVDPEIENSNKDQVEITEPQETASVEATEATEDSSDSSNQVAEIDGEAVYAQRCAVCHGQGVAGAPKLGDAAAWEVRISKGIAMLTENAIKGIGAMPPRGACGDCSDKEISESVKYMVNQVK